MLTVNAEFALRDQGVSNALSIDELPRHRWYFVKEAFSPKLVEQALKTDDVGANELLLDPFSGSGTVPLAGAMAGVRARAFEINPFLRFLSATKLRTADAPAFLSASKTVLRAMKKPVESPLEGYSTFTRGNRWKRWLFPQSVLRGFEAGKRATAALDDASHRALLKLALIGAAMDCCNASRDGKCLRFPSGWARRQVTDARVRDMFEERVAVMAEDLKSTPLRKASAQIMEGDARKLVGEEQNKFRICVTSPPYLNSFDYSDVYRPELFLGNFVDSTAELMKIRLKTVRSHVQAKWEHPERTDFGSLYQDCIANLTDSRRELWDAKLPLMVQAYFEDMEIILKGLRARAEQNASAWLVVSTSAYAGVEVPVDLILAEIGQRSGWYLREVGVLRYLRSSSQHVEHVEDKARKSVPLRESVVILDASKPKAATRPSQRHRS